MLPLALGLALTAAQPIKLALLEVRAAKMDAQLAQFYGEHLAQQLKRSGFTVITQREITALLGIERQKQLMGCADEASNCMAELGNALGADGAVLVDMAQLSGSVRINLKVISTVDGRTLAAYEDRAENDDGTADALTRGSEQIAREVRTALRPEEGMRRLWWLPAVAGLVIAGIGGLVWGLSAGDLGQLNQMMRTVPLTMQQALSYRYGGETKQWVGVVMLAAGAVIAAVGGGIGLFGSDSSVAVVASGAGAGLVFSGGLP